jgi:hypothetical protein
MSSLLRLYDKDNVVLGSVDCEDSVWLLRGGMFFNRYAISLLIEQPGYAARMRLGSWVINTEDNISGLDCHLVKGTTVIFRPGMIAVEMTVAEDPPLLVAGP